MATTSVADYYAEQAHFDAWDPDYLALLGIVGGAAASDRTTCIRALVNISRRSPVCVAMILAEDQERVYIGHTFTTYPADVVNASPFDNQFTCLIGDDLASALPYVLPDTAFTRTAATRVKTYDHIIGAAGHGAGPPAVLRAGPWGGAEPDTHELTFRKVMLLPPAAGPDILRGAVNGAYSLQHFAATFITPGINDPNVDVQAMWTPVRDWFHAASTLTGPGQTTIRVHPVIGAGPASILNLHAWTNRAKTEILRTVGLGGPGLTTAAFDAGIATIQATMNDTHQARIDFDRARSQQTFTEKHGDTLAQRMYWLCGVADDDHLPEVHRLLAKSNSKARHYSILGSILAERAQASTVPLTYASAPIPTTKLVDDVFRTYQPSGTGVTFGQGLTPFAIVCEGHAEMTAVRKALRQTELAEAGTSISLADAESITSTDVRFPTNAQVASEKLYGWSVTADVFHGPAHDIAVSIRGAVLDIAPALHRVVDTYADGGAAGMDLVCRVLFEMQQDYFAYATELANTGHATVPTFSRIKSAVLSYRAESLSPLPAFWYTMVDAPKHRNPKNRDSTASSGRSTSTSGTRTSATGQREMNPYADTYLMARFRDSGHTAISAMIQGKDVTIPKHAGSDCCLSWAYKGACSDVCKRKGAHKKYSRATIQELHKVLDDCGVPNPQP